MTRKWTAVGTHVAAVTAVTSMLMAPSQAQAQDGTRLRGGASVAEVTALSTVAALALGGSATFFLAARSTADQRDAILGNTLYDDGQRYSLDQQQRGEQLLGFTLLAVGVLAASGLTYVLWDKTDDNGVARSVTLTPGFALDGGSLRLDATF